MGASARAIEYLQTLAYDRRTKAEERRLEAETLQKTRKDPLSTYAWMRALSEAQRRNAESEAFLQLSHLLEEKNQPDVEKQPQDSTHQDAHRGPIAVRRQPSAAQITS
jgi:hypothetical protein